MVRETKFCGGKSIALGCTVAALLLVSTVCWAGDTCGEKSHRHISIEQSGDYFDSLDSIAPLDSQSMEAGNTKFSIPFDDRREDVTESSFYIESANGKRRPLVANILHDVDHLTGASIGIIRVDVGSSEPGDKFGLRLTLHQHPQGIGPSIFLNLSRMECADVEVNLDAPVHYSLYTDTRTIPNAREHSEGDRKFWSWSYRTDAPQSGSPKQAWIAISHSPNAASLAASLDAIYEAKINGSPEVASIANQATNGIVGVRRQAAALYYWVSENLRYQILPDNAHSIIPRDVAATLHTRSGDCKDLTLLLESLLRAKQIESVPVFSEPVDPLSTETVVGINQYQHVLLYLPALHAYIDPTVGFIGLDQPPAALSSTVLHPSPTGLTHFPDSYPASTASSDSRLSVTRAGELSGTSTINYSGPRSEYWVSYLATLTKEKRARYVQKLLRDDGYTGSGEFVVEEPDAQPFTAKIGLTFSGHPSEAVGTRIPTNLMFHGLSAVVSDWLGPAPTKQWSCVTGTIEETFHVVTPLRPKPPPPIRAANQFGTYVSQYTFNDGEFTIYRRLEMTPSEPFCDQKQFAAARDLAKSIQQDIEATVLFIGDS